ncbi:MAG: hypothetical protein WC119_05175 [Synergistaceae bacterium]
MADQNQLSNLMPLTPEEIGRATNVPTNTSPHCPPPDILQLQTDTINVLEGRVEISSFELSYQERIKDYYRYSGTAYLSKYPVIAKRTTDTLDVV